MFADHIIFGMYIWGPLTVRTVTNATRTSVQNLGIFRDRRLEDRLLFRLCLLPFIAHCLLFHFTP